MMMQLGRGEGQVLVSGESGGPLQRRTHGPCLPDPPRLLPGTLPASLPLPCTDVETSSQHLGTWTFQANKACLVSLLTGNECHPKNLAWFGLNLAFLVQKNFLAYMCMELQMVMHQGAHAGKEIMGCTYDDKRFYCSYSSSVV